MIWARNMLFDKGFYASRSFDASPSQSRGESDCAWYVMLYRRVQLNLSLIATFWDIFLFDLYVSGPARSSYFLRAVEAPALKQLGHVARRRFVRCFWCGT